MTKPFPIERAIRDPRLFGAGLGDIATWQTWLTVLRAAFGSSLDQSGLDIFAKVAGGRNPPSRRVRELWAICGRRSGKSRMAALVSGFIATCTDRGKLAPGERPMVLTLAATRDQAQVVHGYTLGFLEASPILRKEISEATANEIRLRNGVVIGTHANSFRSIRGRTLLATVFDESSIWRDEASANPDLEVYRAVMPALGPNGMLIGISTPYRRVGLLYAKHRDCFGQDNDDVLVVQGPTLTFNPIYDEADIARKRAADPQGAVAEWDAEFRSDLAAFLDDASIDAAIDRGRPAELPVREDTGYHAFVDMSGGRHDACCICILHREGERIIADVIRGRHGSPAAAAVEFAELAKQYGCLRIVGDNYSAEWVATAFENSGCQYIRSRLTRSELYLEGLPLFTRGLVSIPDHAQLIRELRLLERRTARSGKDSVDHGVGGSDDHSNVLFGAMHLAAKPAETVIVPPIIVTSPQAPGYETMSPDNATSAAAYLAAFR
jgi:hypothetical protein